MADRTAPAPVHISSAVVSVLESRRADVERRIAALPGAEVAHAEGSKIIVVLETGDSGAAGELLARMAAFEGVISANLAFEQAESAETLGEAI